MTNLPQDLALIVAEYCVEPIAKLRDWVDKKKLNWHGLSHNPAAVGLLAANPDKIDWELLSGNTAAVDLLAANPDEIYWVELSRNPAIFKVDAVVTRLAVTQWAKAVL